MIMKNYDSYIQVPSMVKNYMDLFFSHFLDKLSAEPTRTTECTKTLIDDILTIR